MTPLAGKRIVLGVTGGIAAYKAADLCSNLVQAGAVVDVVLTAGARKFVAPRTFNALTRRPVLADPWAAWDGRNAGHVSLAAEAHALIVAPATANAIARLALGLADDLLGLVALSTEAPLLLAPAMEHHMWHHPATQQHVQTLRARAAIFVGPDSGRLASGAHGDGRLVPVEAILGALRHCLGRGGPLAGCRIVITAGPTHEPIDPVRFVGNRSSGRMGFALAQVALDRGAEVHLIAGPTGLTPPSGAAVTRIQTAAELGAATHLAVRDADALIMAAAVADFAPMPAGHKIKKTPGQQDLLLHLHRTPDILASIDQPNLVKVGFAAETEDLIANAQRKLADKRLALIVANPAVETIGSETSAATLLRPDRPPLMLSEAPKEAVAGRIIEEIATILAERRSGPAP